MDPAILPRTSKIYFDSQEAVLSESGDILIPLEEGIITKEDFTGDIGDVLLGNIVGRENDDEIIVYKNVGVGLLDLMTARAIYIKAKEAGIGTEWN
jgi:ornithine cyclodeaminase